MASSFSRYPLTPSMHASKFFQKSLGTRLGGEFAGKSTVKIDQSTINQTFKGFLRQSEVIVAIILAIAGFPQIL